MLQDCDAAIQWASNNVHRYGGNPDNMYIVGQSAGAHISSLCLFAQVLILGHHSLYLWFLIATDHCLRTWCACTEGFVAMSKVSCSKTLVMTKLQAKTAPG